ncbi:MAG: radical SAM protein [Deltaproteobacteria bacterium]|nr:radical SAM protein [Deltaproteobacteria bacterium]
MIRLLSYIALHRMAHRMGLRVPPPFSLTVSLTHRCNLHCRMCSVSTRCSTEMSLEQISRLASSLGKWPRWITFSGGEPFLRKDLETIVELFYWKCRPRVINLPTNATIPETAERAVRIAASCPETIVVANISLDDIGNLHDRIRGVPGTFERAVQTLQRIQKARPKNLKVGIHTVISTLNSDRIDRIAPSLRALKPDHYLTEIAEERWELQNAPLDVKPDTEKLRGALPLLKADLIQHAGDGFSRISASLRARYYDMLAVEPEPNNRLLPCYSGRASAHVDADGTVWACCVEGSVMGRLQDWDFDFRAMWNRSEAQSVRKRIADRACSCPLANSAFTNILMHPSGFFKLSKAWLGMV